MLGFVATVTNTTAGTVQLTGDNFNVDAPLILDYGLYYNNWPPSLGAGDGYADLTFNVDIPLPTAVGLYAGIFEITDDNNDVVGSAYFDVYVTPEPSGLLLLSTGLLALAGLGGSLRRLIGKAGL